MTEHNNVQERRDKDGRMEVGRSSRDLRRLGMIRTCVTIVEKLWCYTRQQETRQFMPRSLRWLVYVLFLI
jgi:hypothetical protein